MSSIFLAITNVSAGVAAKLGTAMASRAPADRPTRKRALKRSDISFSPGFRPSGRAVPPAKKVCAPGASGVPTMPPLRSHRRDLGASPKPPARGQQGARIGVADVAAAKRIDTQNLDQRPMAHHRDAVAEMR